MNLTIFKHSKGNNDRIKSIRLVINEMLSNMDGSANRQEASVQLYGVSSFASMIAIKRGQDTEIAAIVGLLHQYYFYKTGISHFPGINSAETVRPIIRDLKIFTKEEQVAILQAIFYQDQTRKVHGPYDEIIKDAIILHHYFQNLDQNVAHSDLHRLKSVMNELSLPLDHLHERESHTNFEKMPRDIKDKRRLLADISEVLAGQSIIGIPSDKQYQEICKYWPDPDIYKILQDNWCAAFVYHCCMKAGILLPIQYPNGNHRLAVVGAIFDWAKLPETEFMHFDEKNNFTPQRGDIVIFERLLSDKPHDHIGIVLACEDTKILVAEGNRDNQNYSSVVHRDRKHCVYCYIRIKNEYHFHFDGSYNPII